MSENKPSRGLALVNHPHRAWYDEQIINGLPTSHIYSQQTQGRIPPELHVSQRTINEYRNNILKPNTEVVKQFKEEKERAAIEEIHQEIISEPEIQKAIVAKAEKMINAEEVFLTMHTNIQAQITKLATIDDPKTRAQIDVATAIGNLCDQWRLMTMDYLKMQGQIKEAPQTQINIIKIEKNNAEMEALRSAVEDIIGELDPSVLPRFFELFRKRVEPIETAYRLREQHAATDAAAIYERDAERAVNSFISSAGDLKPAE